MISLFAGDQLEQSNPVVGLAMPWRVVGLMALWFLTPPYFLSAGEELQAEKIYAWEFQSSEDRNNDQWPDGWRRRAGRNFPAYIPIRIAPRDPEMARAAREAQPILNRWWLAYQTGNYFKQFIPESSPEPIAQFVDRFLINNCLSIDMDGGAVELESAPFPLDSRFTYNLDAALMAEGLNGHSAWVELLLLNQSLEVVGRAATKSVTGSVPWTWVNANSLNSQVFTHGQIALHVAPGESGQLSGNLKIDEIRLYCMPKLELEVHAPHHVVISGEPIDITCTVLGVQDARSMVNFQLSDIGGKVLERAQVTLTPLASDPAVVETAEASETPRGIMVNKVARTQANAAASPAPLPTISRSHKSDGSAKWSTRISDPGYYRITVNLGRESAHAGGRQISRQASVVVIDDRPAGVGGPFGWSLPDFTQQFTPENVPELIKLAGVGWMKIPIWYDTEDATAADRLSVLLDRLDLRKVNSVGLLDQPARLAGPAKTPRPAAAVFGVNEDWEAALEPVLTRMGMKMTWFQLGRDKDRSFVGNPNLLEIIGDIRNRLQAFSPELQLALAWDYQEPLPEQNGLPWVASQMSTDLQLTANELRSYLADAQRLGHTRWVTLNPLPANRYATLDRVRDLTERMLTVKEQQVEAAFVTTLLDADTGLFHPDGSAGEMFLPWRLLNQHLAAAQYLGSFTMPAGSTNHVLVQGQTGTLVVWNDRPATEQLYLGDNLSATDVWGRSVPLEQVVSSNGQVEHRLQVNEWPLIVNGVNVSVAKWRMNFALKNRSLPSLISQRTDLPIDIENSLAQTASGSVTLHAPSLLQSQVIPVPFQMNPGEQVSLKMAVPIRTDASAGNHSLRFDFQVTGERDYRFSVYDSLTLGAGDVEMRWELLDVSPQRLGLRVELFNHTEAPISFDCKLFPPNQPYRRFQISDIPPGNSVREITLPFAELQTDSMLWIRSEQLGSRRILNYRIPLQSSGMP